MNTFSKTYTIKYVLDFSPNYAWLSNNECINLKTGRTIKQCYVSGSIGYVIEGKFKSLTYLRKHLIKPIKHKIGHTFNIYDTQMQINKARLS